MYRRSSGLWVLRVYAGRDPLTGKKVWRSRTFRGTKREAERALAAFVTEQPVRSGAGAVEDVRRGLGTLARSRVGRPVALDRAGDPLGDQRNLEGLADRKVAAIGVEDLDRFYAALRDAADGVAGRWQVGRWPARTRSSGLR